MALNVSDDAVEVPAFAQNERAAIVERTVQNDGGAEIVEQREYPKEYFFARRARGVNLLSLIHI